MVGLLLGIGSVHLTHNLFLDDVLLVSTFPTSVILIEELCSSLNCVVLFTKSTCLFQTVGCQPEHGCSYSKDGLYFLLPAC